MNKSRKEYYSRHRQQEEAARKAAEEEAEREKQAAAEEARQAALAKLAEEEAKNKKTAAMQLVTEEDKRRDLVNWLKSVPLSENCFSRVDRAFSSGVLVAELINYFCPWMCDTRQYHKWNSSLNKLSNWENLNAKVFPKMGFKLHPRQICNILNPYSCGKFQKDCEKGLFIYKLLFRIRDRLAENNPSVFDYRSPTFVPPEPCAEDKTLRARKRPFRNMLDYPCFSKIEILIANGYYDDKDKDAQKERDADAEPPCSSCSAHIPDFNWNRNESEKMPARSCSCSSPFACYTFQESGFGTEICIPTTFNLKGHLMQSTNSFSSY